MKTVMVATLKPFRRQRTNEEVLTSDKPHHPPWNLLPCPCHDSESRRLQGFDPSFLRSPLRLRASRRSTNQLHRQWSRTHRNLRLHPLGQLEVAIQLRQTMMRRIYQVPSLSVLSAPPEQDLSQLRDGPVRKRAKLFEVLLLRMRLAKETR